MVLFRYCGCNRIRCAPGTCKVRRPRHSVNIRAAPMTDYYPVISHAVTALRENTASTRRALYDRARTTLTARLRGRDPPLDQKDFDRECLALENAINRIEREI